MKTLDASYQELETLEVPEGIKGVFCHNNNLTKLELPEGIDLYI